MIPRCDDRTSDGLLIEETTYGVTSLTAQKACLAQVLQIVRGHWGIEDGLHYRRDDTLYEDRCRLKGQGAYAMAVINNLVLGLPLRRGVVNVPDARWYYAANLHEAVALVLHSPT